MAPPLYFKAARRCYLPAGLPRRGGAPQKAALRAAFLYFWCSKKVYYLTLERISIILW
jgi:hypothetical protein